MVFSDVSAAIWLVCPAESLRRYDVTEVILFERQLDHVVATSKDEPETAAGEGYSLIEFSLALLAYALIGLPVGVLMLHTWLQSAGVHPILVRVGTLVGLFLIHGMFLLWSRTHSPFFYKVHVAVARVGVKWGSKALLFGAARLPGVLVGTAERFARVATWIRKRVQSGIKKITR